MGLFMMRYLDVTGEIKTLRETGPGGLRGDKGDWPYRASIRARGAKLMRNFTMVMRPSLSLRQALLPVRFGGYARPKGKSIAGPSYAVQCARRGGRKTQF
jgi:hypothetical protein